MTPFDPNHACAPNGNFFGFPYTEEEASLILIPVPWDVTTSYRPGTAQGPQAILDASIQLDFFDFEIPEAWNLGIGSSPMERSSAIARKSAALRPVAERAIAFQEKNFQSLPDNYGEKDLARDLAQVEQGGEELGRWLEKTCLEYLQAGKATAVVGGDHSVPLGHFRALASKYPDFAILHLDAHADLRKAYEGFRYSHASIMHNALQIGNISRIVQIGIRDVCQEEQERVKASQGRIIQFPDLFLQQALLEGRNWADCCRQILETLPSKVYVSFDIDVLEPSLCPHTGTPVPGGLGFAQIRYLLSALRRSGKEIIGFDLCEVAPDPLNPENEWDGNVGARILYMLSNTLLGQKTH